MRRSFLVGLLLPLLLSACGSADLTQVKTDAEEAIKASSGAIRNFDDTLRDAVELGTTVVDRAKEGIESVKETSQKVGQGIEYVKDGVNSLQEGGKLIEGIVHGQSVSSSSAGT